MRTVDIASDAYSDGNSRRFAMNRSILFTLVACPVLAFGQGRPVDDIDYGYFALGYLDTSTDVIAGTTATEFDGSGFSIDGSLELRDHIHAFLSYTSNEFDATPDATIGTRWGGLGTHWSVHNKVSVYGRLGFVNGDGYDGSFLEGGVRWVPADGYELRGGFQHVDPDIAGVDSDTGVFIAGDLMLTGVTALTATFASKDNSQEIGIGVRFYFGDENSRRLNR